MRKILSEEEAFEVNKHYRQAELYMEKKYAKIGEILEPIVKRLDDFSDEEIQHLIYTMPPVSFYRAEIRGYLVRRREDQQPKENTHELRV